LEHLLCLLSQHAPGELVHCSSAILLRKKRNTVVLSFKRAFPSLFFVLELLLLC